MNKGIQKCICPRTAISLFVALSSSFIYEPTLAQTNSVMDVSSVVSADLSAKVYTSALGLGKHVLEQINTSEKYLATLDAKLFRAEQLTAKYEKAWEALYGNGKGAGTVGEISDAYAKLEKAKGILANTKKQLSSNKTKVENFVNDLNGGIQKGAKVAGVAMDVATVVSALSTISSENASLMEKISAGSAIASVALTNTKTGGKTGPSLILFDLTLTATDIYVDATRDVAVNIADTLRKDNTHFRNTARSIITNIALEHPEASREQIIELAKPEINQLASQYFEIYQAEGNIYNAVFGKGLSKLAAGTGNLASGGAAVTNYTTNLDLFTGSVTDNNDPLYKMIAANTDGAIRKINELKKVAAEYQVNANEIENSYNAFIDTNQNVTSALAQGVNSISDQYGNSVIADGVYHPEEETKGSIVNRESTDNLEMLERSNTKSDFSRNNLMQNQLTAITQGGSSRIGTASYFIGRPPVQDRVEKPSNMQAAMREQKFNVADLKGIRETSQYTNGQILSAPVDILLDWGTHPSDLDSHLTGPMANGSSTRFHTYYSSRGSLESAPNALLHSDYTNHRPGGANLPEQTRINVLNEGVYRFYVHDFSNRNTTGSTALANSGATVTFHNAGSTAIVEGQGIGQEVARIVVPTNGTGNTWQAFELDSRTGILNSTTQFHNISNPAEVPFNN